MLARVRQWAAALQRDVLALWFAYRDPRTPLVARILAMLIVAYALSPIDLIPDFVPLLGYLDELLLLPAAIYVAVKLVPAPVLEDSRVRAAHWAESRRARPRSYLAAAVIVVIWLGLAWLAWRLVAPLLPR